jgi:hypothetical protein
MVSPLRQGTCEDLELYKPGEVFCKRIKSSKQVDSCYLGFYLICCIVLRRLRRLVIT